MSTIVVSGSTPAEVSVTIPQVNNIVVTPPDVQSVSVSVVAAPGAPGQGLVSGGSENQFIQKNSATDYDTKWSAYTLPAADGLERQALIANGDGTVSFDYVRSTYLKIQNDNGAVMPAGTPVYPKGIAGDRVLVGKALCGDSSKMPAIGILLEETANGGTGYIITAGNFNKTVSGLSGVVAGQKVYVSATGTLTNVRPTGATNLVQNIGTVLQTNGSNIQKMKVSAIDRSNDVPNIATGNIWAGNADGVATATDTAYIDIANRRVGIGTVTPTTPLHVVGNIRVNASTDHVYSNRFTAIANADVYLRSYNGYNLILNGDTGDNVGIGTTSPAQKLDVNGIALTKGVRAESTTDYSLITRDSGGNTVLYVQSANSNTNQPIAKFNYGSTTANSGTTVLTIGKDISYFNATNVGIGTSSPGQKLTVDQGVGNVNQGIPATTGSAQNGILRLQPGGPYGESFDFGMNVATTYAWIQPTNKGNHSVNYNLSLNPNGGNVGIGTTSPDERLHVNGKILVSANDIAYAAGYFTKITSNYADNPFVLESRAGTLMSAKDYGRTLAFYAGPDGSTAEVMRVDEDGKVGIGTTTPNYLLDVESAGAGARVYNTVGSTSVYLTTPAAQNASLYFGPSTDNDEGHITYRTASSSMAFTTNTSEAMRIDSSGNVGIGTSSPASPLHVYSDNAATDTSGGLTIEQDGTGDALLQFLLTGSKRWVVGIDNDANNNFKISGTSDLGTDNGLTITNSTYNVGIGTTSPSAKLDVVGLVNINDGSNNVMISSRNTAMAASSGSNNTAVGDVAGFINASGNNNSFFGRAAGYYSTGYNNVLLGMEAGYGGATSTFSNTVAVGYQALYDLTSGAGNTAVGYQASTNINSGNNNTSVGYQAGYAITSGSSNSFFGTYAGVSTTGSENTAVGHSASFSNTTGTNNVAIGRGAGYTNSTGSGNIFIGYQAGYYETGSNKLYIDNSSASIPLIYGDFNLRAATINGDLTVSGGDFRADSIEINGRSQTSPAPSTGEYGAGSKIVTQFATGTVTAGVVYVASSGAWVQGDADVGSASIGMIAVATDSASAAEMLIEGVIKLSSNAGFSGASAGDVLYLSNTAGELTDTAPSGTGDYVRICGYVVNASQNEVFFSPSKEWRVV